MLKQSVRSIVDIGKALTESPYLPKMSAARYGSVDEVSLTRVTGWAIIGNGKRPAEIAVLVAGQIVKLGFAEICRPDVKGAGFPTDICGFDLEVNLAPRDLFGNNIRIAFRINGQCVADVPISTAARPWAVGFWGPDNRAYSVKWLSLAQRLEKNSNLLPVQAKQAANSKFLLEGPVKGDYSIAIVNRSFASAMLAAGQNVGVTSDDQEMENDPHFNSEKELVSRYLTSPNSGDFEVHSLNTWPPETGAMQAPIRTLHCYAWEESSFPPNFLQGFNENLDLICATSNFTKVALENSGLTTPSLVIGNGIDPDLFDLQRRPQSKRGRYRFLHISSCFARKAVDKLIDAFVSEFEHEEVELYIKTFDNPHNNVREIIGQYGARARNITLDVSHAPTARIRELYASADCLVAVSRGEGFLLPAAEAMAVGLPVIVAEAGGQSDFCDNTTSWLVSAPAVQSGTHMSLHGSYWFEPDVGSFRQQMRSVYGASELEIRQKTTLARSLVKETYRWDRVAARYLSAVSSERPQRKEKPELALVTTWNQSCGIATYSHELYPHISEKFKIQVLAENIRDTTSSDETFVSRVWNRRRDSITALADKVIDGGFEAVLIQHHPSHFSWDDLAHFVDCVVQGSNNRIRVFCQLHSTAHQSAAIERVRLSLARLDVIFVHTIGDVEALGRIPGDTRVAMVPHGIPKPQVTPVNPVRNTRGFHIGSFGFCMPHKGIKNHIRALSLLRDRIPGMSATLMHAVNDDEKTVQHAVEVHSLAKKFDLLRSIDFDFRFLSKSDVWRRLQSCDLIVLPYDSNLESASGAIRDVLGTGVPILTTAISTFTDVEDIVFQTPTNHPFDLAKAIMKIYGDLDYRRSKHHEQMKYVEALSWKNAGNRISNIMLSEMK